MSEYGLLTLVRRERDIAFVRCRCGIEKQVNWWNLKAGRTRSCGCQRLATIGAKATKHGFTHLPEYHVWQQMIYRCTRETHPEYHRYGGRGIRVCERWEQFENFLADMGTRPPGMELDRIDNDGNYEPGNCRWATRITQANNTRRNRVLEFRGERLTVAQLARRVGLNPSTLRRRLDVGDPIELALTPGLHKGKRLYGEPLAGAKAKTSRVASPEPAQEPISTVPATTLAAPKNSSPPAPSRLTQSSARPLSSPSERNRRPPSRTRWTKRVEAMT